MKEVELQIGDFVIDDPGPPDHAPEDGYEAGIGLVVSTDVRKGLPPLATVLWPNGTSSTRWQDDLTVVEGHTYLIKEDV